MTIKWPELDGTIEAEIKWAKKQKEEGKKMLARMEAEKKQQILQTLLKELNCLGANED